MTVRIGQSTNYRLIARTGVGGMAEIFLAIQETGSLSRRVAIKRLLPSLARDPVHREMFLEEARLASRLHHPAIPAVYSLIDCVEPPAIAMEWIDGKTLRELEQEGLGDSDARLSAAEVRSITFELLEVLEYLSELRDDEGNHVPLYHRDLAPENILVDAAGRVRLVDFGIAKGFDSKLATQTGILKGRLAYLPPEIARGEPFGPSGDLYSLALIVVEALGGSIPNSGIDPASQLAMLRDRNGPPSLPASIPARILFLAALDPDPARRPNSPSEFRRRLEREWPVDSPSIPSLRERIGRKRISDFPEPDVSLYWGQPTPVLKVHEPIPRSRLIGKVMIGFAMALVAAVSWSYENRHGTLPWIHLQTIEKQSVVPTPSVVPVILSPATLAIIPPVPGELFVGGISNGLISAEMTAEMPSGFYTIELRSPPDRFYRTDIFLKPGERYEWKPADSALWKP